MRQILVIEDDEDIALSLKYNLEREGYFVVTALDGEAGLRRALGQPPELILLDLNLPGMDGLEVCRALRKQPAAAGVPIIVLTARVEESDKLTGLDLGADDYITKPFSMKEVIARVRALLRRTGRHAAEDEVLATGPIRLEASSRTVLVNGREVKLTRKEFDLLADLLRNRGRVQRRERLLQRVWGYEYPGETRTVDVHVRRLRKKLGPPADDWIETVVGVGYRVRAGD